jgi:hypothetical protein
MKLSSTEFTCRTWRIHGFTEDFNVEDVWAVPITGTRDDFAAVVDQMLTVDLSTSSSPVVRALVAIRLIIGRAMGWDSIDPADMSLRDRLPDDLRHTEIPSVPEDLALPFTPLYVTDDEAAVEIINKTVHGIIHLGWVSDAPDRYRAQMTILVRPRGLLGSAYMQAIKPFRYWIVYPHLLSDIENRWRTDRTQRSR